MSQRRPLDSFAPFRADEMVEDSFNSRGTPTYAYFPKLGGRLRVARETMPDLKIATTVERFYPREHAVVQAVTTSAAKGTAASAYGYADKDADGRLADSLLELAESRAVTRALRYMGIGIEFNGAEEMEGRATDRAPAAPTKLASVPTTTAPAPERVSDTKSPNGTETKAPPAPLQKGRADIGVRLMELAFDPNDKSDPAAREAAQKRRAVDLLSGILPGRKSVASLEEDDVWRVKYGLGLMKGNGNSLPKAKEFTRDVLQLPWVDTMSAADKEIAGRFLKTGDLPKPKEDDIPF